MVESIGGNITYEMTNIPGEVRKEGVRLLWRGLELHWGLVHKWNYTEQFL